MKCARCDHDLSKHCPGHVRHVDHKYEMWPQAPPGSIRVCEVRHCLLPLCSCVNFIEPKESA